MGTIIGAGIYVLIGKVAAVSGVSTAYAFLLSGFIAMFSALSYAELASRFPQSSGESAYVSKAFNRDFLARIVGWMVVLTGIVSSATLANGFLGYLNVFIDISSTAAIISLILALTALSAWGIKESVFLIAAITLLEVGGLIFVVLLADGNNGIPWSKIVELPWSPTEASSILVGSFLAFYAFIGFEDMDNVAEEVKEPRKTIPIAIIWAVVLSTLLYVIVAAVAIRHMPIADLAKSDAPLADIISQSGYSPVWISLISLIAVINGILVQLIMASRVLYGMGKQGLAPEILSRVNSRTQTPIISTLIIALFILIFALWLPLITLAKITSFFMLSIFTLMNISLIVVKRKDKETLGVTTFPIWVPIIGTFLCLMLLVAQI